MDDDAKIYEDYETQEGAAEFLGVHINTLWRWRKENIGPKYMVVGGLYRYPRKWLVDYLRSTVVTPENQSTGE